MPVNAEDKATGIALFWVETGPPYREGGLGANDFRFASITPLMA